MQIIYLLSKFEYYLIVMQYLRMGFILYLLPLVFGKIVYRLLVESKTIIMTTTYIQEIMLDL